MRPDIIFKINVACLGAYIAAKLHLEDRRSKRDEARWEAEKARWAKEDAKWAEEMAKFEEESAQWRAERSDEGVKPPDPEVPETSWAAWLIGSVTPNTSGRAENRRRHLGPPKPPPENPKQTSWSAWFTRRAKPDTSDSDLENS